MDGLLEDRKMVLFYVLLGKGDWKAEPWTFIEFTLRLDEVTIIHQLPGPAHWSLSSNHSLRTDFVISASCLKKPILRRIEELCPSAQIKEKNQDLCLDFCLKIYAFFYPAQTATWGACWTLVFPPDLLLFYEHRGETLLEVYYCYSFLFEIVSQWLHKCLWRAKLWHEITASSYHWTLENNLHLDDQVLHTLVHTQQLLGGPFPFVLVWGAEAWTQSLMHVEQKLWQCYIPQLFTWAEWSCNLPEYLGIKFLRGEGELIYYISHIFISLLICSYIHMSVCICFYMCTHVQALYMKSGNFLTSLSSIIYYALQIVFYVLHFEVWNNFICYLTLETEKAEIYPI